jgi:hypothetical protein
MASLPSSQPEPPHSSSWHTSSPVNASILTDSGGTWSVSVCVPLCSPIVHDVIIEAWKAVEHQAWARFQMGKAPGYNSLCFMKLKQRNYNPLVLTWIGVKQIQHTLFSNACTLFDLYISHKHMHIKWIKELNTTHVPVIRYNSTVHDLVSLGILFCSWVLVFLIFPCWHMSLSVCYWSAQKGF